MHFESSGPESQFKESSAGETDFTDQVLIFLYILNDKEQIIQYNKKPPVNKQRKQKNII